MEVLVYIANCLYLSAYLVQDMLRLRSLTLVATACLLAYFYLRPEPLLTVVFWNLFFVVLNAIQIVRLVVRRRRSAAAGHSVEPGELIASTNTSGPLQAPSRRRPFLTSGPEIRLESK